MIHVLIEEAYVSLVAEGSLKQAGQAVLAHQGADPNTDLSIVIDSDEKLHNLNRDFLGIDAPTDVLSFPSDEFDPDEQAVYIGDVIISFQRAEAQAKNAGHPVINEIQLLVVHGVLHLLGHDHADPTEKTRMWTAQAEILDQLGVQINQLPE
ncbi:MAG TPA: rRNA maturation RNase YbeY [Anaerolineaceae bacterium]|nr:MAG: rRNA maturation RNase YbeY [Chloroflexi bacterium GWB2_54_36]HAL16927.1 rRNA maturation RNase YbeY [Anaerolineaceae bacterium]HBA92910.1 rRNA maturation RNase YbeY [Anaerolineaceae bacterium]